MFPPVLCKGRSFAQSTFFVPAGTRTAGEQQQASGGGSSCHHVPCRQRHASAACREEAAAEAGFRPPGGSVQDRLSARRQGLCQASNLSTSILEQASLSTLEAFWRWSHTMGISCRHEVLVLHDLKSCEDGSLATCSGRRQPCERSCLAEKGNACDGL